MSKSEFLLPDYPHKFPLVIARNSKVARELAGKRKLDFQQAGLVALGFHWNSWLTYAIAAQWKCPVYPKFNSPNSIAQWRTYMLEAAAFATVSGNTALAEDFRNRMGHDKFLLCLLECSASTLETAIPTREQGNLNSLKPKRSSHKGEAKEKLISTLTKHHKYADGGSMNLEPIGNNKLAKLAEVSPSTASAFFNEKFEGHAKYRTLCQDSGRLVAALKLLNNEFAPHVLYGRRPADEDDRDD